MPILNLLGQVIKINQSPNLAVTSSIIYISILWLNAVILFCDQNIVLLYCTVWKKPSASFGFNK